MLNPVGTQKLTRCCSRFFPTHYASFTHPIKTAFLVNLPFLCPSVFMVLITYKSQAVRNSCFFSAVGIKIISITGIFQISWLS